MSSELERSKGGSGYRKVGEQWYAFAYDGEGTEVFCTPIESPETVRKPVFCPSCNEGFGEHEISDISA